MREERERSREVEALGTGKNLHLAVAELAAEAIGLDDKRRHHIVDVAQVPALERDPVEVGNRRIDDESGDVFLREGHVDRELFALRTRQEIELLRNQARAGREARGFNLRDATGEIAKAAARSKVQHFVLVSSVAIYGTRLDHLDSPLLGCPQINDYARSIWVAEKELLRVSNESGMKVTILRLGTLYGEEDPGNVFRLIRAIDRRRFVWIGNGENQKNLLHRDDAARACIVAARDHSADRTHIFDVVGEAVTTRELVNTVSAQLGRTIPGFHVPPILVKGPIQALRFALPFWNAPQRWLQTLDKWLRSDVRSSQPFCERYEFSTQVSFEEGIRRELAWYRRQVDLPVRHDSDTIQIRKAA